MLFVIVGIFGFLAVLMTEGSPPFLGLLLVAVLVAVLMLFERISKLETRLANLLEALKVEKKAEEAASTPPPVTHYRVRHQDNARSQQAPPPTEEPALTPTMNVAQVHDFHKVLAPTKKSNVDNEVQSSTNIEAANAEVSTSTTSSLSDTSISVSLAKPFKTEEVVAPEPQNTVPVIASELTPTSQPLASLAVVAEKVAAPIKAVESQATRPLTIKVEATPIETVENTIKTTSDEFTDAIREDVKPNTQEDISKETVAEFLRQNHSQNSSSIPPTPSLLASAWGWLFGGNLFVRLGIAILFLGIVFLLRYSIERHHISIEARLLGAAALAVGLLIIGWRLRARAGSYGLILQAGGVGLLYLTIFASYSLFHVLPSLLSFALLTITVAGAVLLAVLQNSLALAIFATTGGFLAPILTSSGSNNYVGLFSFYVLLNAGIVSIAWFKSWRILNLIGFIFTFVIAGTWGWTQYKPENFSTTEPFLIIFFIFYVLIAVLFATRTPPNFKDKVDSSLVFGVPLIGSAMQYALVKDFPYGVSISAVVTGAFYLLLSTWLWKRYGKAQKLLTETFLALGVIFTTLAIPFAVEGTLSASAWAIEGAGILWISIRQQQVFRRIFAYLLSLSSVVLLLVGMVRHPLAYDAQAFINGHYMSMQLIALALMISSWLLYKPFTDKRSYEVVMGGLFYIIALIFIFIGFEYQTVRFIMEESYIASHLIFVVVLTLILLIFEKITQWSRLLYTQILTIIPYALAFIYAVISDHSIFTIYQMAAWSITLVLYLYSTSRVLSQYQVVDANNTITLNLTLISVVALIGLMLAPMMLLTLLFIEGSWQALIGLMVFSLVLYLLTSYRNSSAFKFAFMPVHAGLFLLPILVLFSDGADIFDLKSHRASYQPSFEIGWILWPLAIVIHYLLLRLYEKREWFKPYLALLHIVLVISILVMLIPELSRHSREVVEFWSGWHLGLIALPLILTLLWITLSKRWPISSFQVDFTEKLCLPLILLLVIWMVLSLLSSGANPPLMWLPVLNALDLTTLAIIVTLLATQRNEMIQTHLRIEPQHIKLIILGLLFFWLNWAIFRFQHHWMGLAWKESIVSDTSTQTMMTILWALSGLALIWVGHNKAERKLWLLGAMLLGAVVLKLFLVEFRASGTLSRIVSFISVGVVMLVIGYLAPLPPADKEDSTNPTDENSKHAF